MIDEMNRRLTNKEPQEMGRTEALPLRIEERGIDD